MSFSSKNLALVAISLNFILAGAQNQTTPKNCSDISVNFFENGYNATGSVTIPGFRVNASYPESQWTWSRYISDEYIPSSNTSTVWQTFGIETSPVQNLSDPSLPYTGCIMALLPPETGFPSAGEKDNGSCTSVLTPDCVNEILTNIQQSAQAIYLTTTGSAESYTCPQLMDTVGDSKDSKCYQQWGGSVSSRFLTNNFTGPTYPYCLNPTNPGQSNAENQSFFSWGTGSTKGLTNYSNYDPTIRIPQPLIVATWLKAVTNSNTVDQPAQGNWADTRLLCIPGNVTTPGSRNITEADKAAGAAKIGSLNSQMAFVVALTVGLGLIL